MAWKNWPVWVKGGIIASLLGLIYSLLSTIFIFQVPEVVSKHLYVFGILICGLKDGDGILPATLCKGSLGLVLVIISALILLFIIGSLIGLIIGKIKSTKKGER